MRMRIHTCSTLTVAKQRQRGIKILYTGACIKASHDALYVRGTSRPSSSLALPAPLLRAGCAVGDAAVSWMGLHVLQPVRLSARPLRREYAVRGRVWLLRSLREAGGGTVRRPGRGGREMQRHLAALCVPPWKHIWRIAYGTLRKW